MSNSLSKYKPIDDMTKPLHITLAIPRTLKGVGANVLEEINYTYYQSVCSCGWHGDYKVSKLTAQEDKCPNRPMSIKETDAYKEAERLIKQKGHP